MSTQSTFDGLLRQTELEAFLNSFVPLRAAAGRAGPDGIEGVLQDVKALWKANKFLNPAQLKAELLVSYLPQPANPDLARSIRQTADFSENPETVTGYLSKGHGHTLDGLAHLYARETGNPVTRLAGDFTNLGGLTKHFEDVLRAEATASGTPLDESKIKAEAYQMADGAMSVICKAVKDELKKVCKEHPGAQFSMCRTGGDEVNGYLIGVPTEKRDQILGRVHGVIESQVARMGLQDHEALKEGRKGNNLYNGTGLVWSAKPLDDKVNPATISHEQDMEMGVTKLNIGHTRLGTVDQPLAKAEIEAQARLDKTALAPGDIDARLKALETKVQADSKSLHKLNPDARYDTLRGYSLLKGQSRSGYVKDYIKKALGARPALTPSPVADREDTVDVPPLSSLADRHIAAINDNLKAQGQTLSPREKAILSSSLEALSPQDPSSHTKMPQEMIKTLHNYAAETPRYLAEKNLPETAVGSAVAVSFHGLAGVNLQFGHDVADLALRHMAHNVIGGAMKEAGVQPQDFVLAHHGGGNFSMAVKPCVDHEGVMKTFTQALDRRVQDMNQTPIANIAAAQDPRIAAGMKADFESSPVKTLGDLPDSKSRETSFLGKKIEGKVNGIHAVVVQKTIGNAALNGQDFISSLRNEADAKLNTLRQDVVLSAHQKATAPSPENPKRVTQRVPLSPRTPSQQIPVM